MASTLDSWPSDVVASWVTASCAAQGVPVKIADPLTIARVRTLLGGADGAADGARGTASEAGTPGCAAARRAS